MATKTKKYRCLQTRIVHDHREGTADEMKYVEGRDYELSDESYARWERRNVFGPIPEKPKKRHKAKAADDGAPATDDDADPGAPSGPAPGAAMATTG